MNAYICSCNICIHHTYVDYAGGTPPPKDGEEIDQYMDQLPRAMQEQRSGVPSMA
ncbi:MAG: hypothetical protein WC856_05040 [Methylococcaceae bacterium]